MKKNPTLILILLAVTSLLIFFSACEKLKVSNLKAHSYLNDANRLFGEEKYKKAIEEYRKALELKDIKTAYLYIGIACTRSYKPVMLPPEKNDEYKVKLAENEKHQEVIKGNDEVMKEIEENNTELKRLITENKNYEQEINKNESEYRNIAGYGDYSRKLEENKEHKRTIRINNKYITKASQKEEEPEKTSEKKEKTGIAAIEAEEAAKRKKEEQQKEIEERIRENEKLLKTVNANETDINAFMEKEEYVNISQKIEELKNKITENEEKLKQITDYEDYSVRVEENQKLMREVNRNNLFINKVKKNEEYRRNAIDYLEKAREINTDRMEIIYALADLYNKMSEEGYDQAERYYLLILKKNSNNPKSYYNMANFYKNNLKFDEAEDMYEKRIALEPEKPEGYHYYAGYFQDRKMWNKAIENHGLRLEKLEKSEEMEENVKKNILTEAYYDLGVVCWNKSYQTKDVFMSKEERELVIQKGMDALNKSLEFTPKQPNPWNMIGLLWLERKKVQPLREEEFHRRSVPETTG